MQTQDETHGEKQDEKSAGEWFASLGSGGIAVLGAGSSGIAAAKILHERGLPFVCFEKGSGIGGNWRYQNDNEMSSAYWSLHINTSRDRMAYSDFPMPPSYPDFPHHTQIMEYFESYVDHFGFRSKIAFQTEIREIEPSSDGKGAWVSWSKKTGEEGRLFFRAVIVANGHHWDPYQPTLPGHFQTLAGKEVHFVDGTMISPDLIIYATGYRISFPFLAPGVFAVQDNKIGLYKRVLDPRFPQLFFLGLIQPLGAIMPLAEAQGEWIADLLEGKALLPPTDAMLREIKRDQEAVAKRYTPSPRHTIQVDFFPYLASLQKERKDGHKRKLQQRPTL